MPRLLKKFKKSKSAKQTVYKSFDSDHDESEYETYSPELSPDCRSNLKYGSGIDYIPIAINHGPGLYRSHTMVSGDSIRLREFNRTYIHHRPAFDWYRNDRYNLIDDIEEILLPGHQQRREYTYNFNPRDTYEKRIRRRNRCRSYELQPQYQPEPKYYQEPVVYSQPEPKPVVYSQPEPTYSNITSIKTVEMPKYTGPDVIYHGKTANPNDYNQDFSIYKSKSLNNFDNGKYRNYQTTVDRSAYVSGVQDIKQDHARQILLDLQRLERESRQEKSVHFGSAVTDKYRDHRYN